jgi:hypothetical protein
MACPSSPHTNTSNLGSAIRHSLITMQALPPYHQIKIEKFFVKDFEDESNLYPDSQKKLALVEVIAGEHKGRYIVKRANIIHKDIDLIHEDNLDASI